MPPVWIYGLIQAEEMLLHCILSLSLSLSPLSLSLVSLWFFASPGIRCHACYVTVRGPEWEPEQRSEYRPSAKISNIFFF